MAAGYQQLKKLDYILSSVPNLATLNIIRKQSIWILIRTILLIIGVEILFF